MKKDRRVLISCLIMCALVLAACAFSNQAMAAAKAQADTKIIAEDAMIYSFPMIMCYAAAYEMFIDKTSSQYKCPINTLFNEADVFTPKDTAVVTPNSDTPYSFILMDLRSEPMVLTVPDVEKGRYFSVQLVDLYTCNYGYIGSRTTGNGAGSFVIAGPGWKGETPAGVKKVFRCETGFSLGLFRTQLFNPRDIDKVKKIQAGYRVQPLSQFLHTPAPPAAPAVAWPKIDKKLVMADPFSYLNFLLQFCPPTGPAEGEKALRARFATLGIEAGKPFPPAGFTAAQKADLEAGAKIAVEKIIKRAKALGKNENGWSIATGAFGDRAMYKGDWLQRAGAAKAGIFGNDAAEALYPMLLNDSDGNKPDASRNRYTLTFPAGQLPPVNAFWSVTMYDGKTQLLVANPVNRYLINSPMLGDLKKNADGSLTIYIQKDTPGKEKESNWLPAPDGPVYLVMRLYWPKENALNGAWKPPALRKAQ